MPCRHEVLLEDCGEALTRHQPHVVLCCWMPLGVDFTQAIRQTPTVQHYILVRPCRQSFCSSDMTAVYRGRSKTTHTGCFRERSVMIETEQAC